MWFSNLHSIKWRNNYLLRFVRNFHHNDYRWSSLILFNKIPLENLNSYWFLKINQRRSVVIQRSKFSSLLSPEEILRKQKNAKNENFDKFDGKKLGLFAYFTI